MKNLASFAVAALLVISSAQFAAAGPRHHQARTDGVTTQQQNRNRDAYASWPTEQQDWRDAGPAAYSGGFSAPAGR